MKWAIAIGYVFAAITTGSVLIEMDRHRCHDTAPGTYLLYGAVWPLVGGVFATLQLLGTPSTSRCG